MVCHYIVSHATINVTYFMTKRGLLMTTNIISKEVRPWGYYEVLLDASDCKVKRITVKPNQRLSYQRHTKREEYWTVIQGQAVVTLDNETITLKPGGQIHIPLEHNHRVQNSSHEPLVFIEIQRGTYFGEDDIIRIEDDYNRAG